MNLNDYQKSELIAQLARELQYELALTSYPLATALGLLVNGIGGDSENIVYADVIERANTVKTGLKAFFTALEITDGYEEWFKAHPDNHPYTLSTNYDFIYGEDASDFDAFTDFVFDSFESKIAPAEALLSGTEVTTKQLNMASSLIQGALTALLRDLYVELVEVKGRSEKERINKAYLEYVEIFAQEPSDVDTFLKPWTDLSAVIATVAPEEGVKNEWVTGKDADYISRENFEYWGWLFSTDGEIAHYVEALVEAAGGETPTPGERVAPTATVPATVKLTGDAGTATGTITPESTDGTDADGNPITVTFAFAKTSGTGNIDPVSGAIDSATIGDTYTVTATASDAGSVDGDATKVVTAE